MASENETVADVVRELRAWGNVDVSGVGRDILRRDAERFADRIEAAHRREAETARIAACSAQARFDEELAAKESEVAELRECVRQAYTDVCLKCTRNGRNVVCSRDRECENVKRWRKALEGANDETK